MIVRTYQRRSRNAVRTTFSDCEEESSSQEYLGFSSLGPSSQDSSSWHYSNNSNQEAKQKAKPPSGLCPPTSTLMEAQESGEMMEHVDEANFALDGLKPGQPLRIQRASLVSLLSICTSAQQRRLLRTQGMAKTVLDAIVALSTDDPPTALAAAALFYALASDGQDEQLLDSAVCIKFLLKLLVSSIPESSEKKASLGRKLLGVTTSSSMLKAPVSGVDRGGVAITVKVQKLLSSMKEIHVANGEQDEDRDCFQFQELDSKWLALLTLEKACLSTVALEDTSGSVRRVGGNFKERLRELGGLDAICDVAINCFSFLKEVLEEHFLDAALKSAKTSKMIESVRVLLKCMKVMENATFLSEQNQKHLLETNLKLKSKGLELSFINLVISCIKTLSELLVKHKSQSSVYGRHRNSTVPENDAHISHSSKCHTKTTKESQISSTVTAVDEDLKESKKVPSSASAPNGRRGNRRTGKISSLQDNIVNSINTEKTLSTSLSSCKFSIAGSDDSCAFTGETLNKNGFDNDFLGISSKKRLTTSSTGNVQDTSAWQSVKLVDQRSDCSEDLADPFMFIDEETAPMKVKQINRQKKLKGLQSSDTKVSVKSNGEAGTHCCDGNLDLDIVKDSVTMKGKQFNRQKKLKGLQTSDTRVNAKLDGEDGSQCCDNAVDLDIVKERCGDEIHATGKQESEECALLGDCLLAAVKVIMNLTNDNPMGCNQVASCGGLDTMAALIVDHYPLFQSRLFISSEEKGKKSGSKPMENGSNSFSQNEEALSDQDLDLLVVILGVLVNLVEKDTVNRARLAASSVILPRKSVGDFEVRECRRAVIPLLCSIFLTKQGAGEAAEGGGSLAMESTDEVAIKQGQREAENMIVEAYAALLLGFLSKESKNARHAIALCLPGRNLKVLVPVLERFVAFHLSLNMISSETHASVTEVIESCKKSI